MAASDIGETARGGIRVVSIYLFLLLLFLLNLADMISNASPIKKITGIGSNDGFVIVQK